MRTLVAGCLALVAIVLPSHAGAQWQPTKPITIVVGFAPGGGSDSSRARLQNAAQPFFPVPIVVLNKAGAAGTTAAAEVARGPAGWLHVVRRRRQREHVGRRLSSAALRYPQGFPRRSCERPAIRNSVVVAANSPIKTMQELVAKAKANPGSVNFGSSGPGSLVHATTEVFAKRADVKLQHMPVSGRRAGVAGRRRRADRFPDFGARRGAGAARRRHRSASSRSRARSGSTRIRTCRRLRELGYDVVGDNMKGLVAAGGPAGRCLPIPARQFQEGPRQRILAGVRDALEVQDRISRRAGIPEGDGRLFSEISDAVKQ